MELRLTRRERRTAALLAAATGLVHLLLPELFIDLARLSYDAVLDVSLVARDGTVGRVRLAGVGCCLVAVLVWLAPGLGSE
jgi:hypothetical protein